MVEPVEDCLNYCTIIFYVVPPISQNWGPTNFTTPPTGFAAWDGLNGLTINTQALAESSVPTADAPIIGSTPISGGAGGCESAGCDEEGSDESGEVRGSP